MSAAAGPSWAQALALRCPPTSRAPRYAERTSRMRQPPQQASLPQVRECQHDNIFNTIRYDTF